MDVWVNKVTKSAHVASIFDCMRLCKTCQQDHSESDFYVDKRTDRVGSSCKACVYHRACLWQKNNRQQSRYNKDEWIRNNPQKIKDSGKQTRAKNKKRGQELVAVHKQSPCIDCGQQFPPEAMDFDHRDGVHKKENVAQMVSASYSTQTIMEEILKCDLVCACCHRLRTFNRQGYSDSPSRQKRRAILNKAKDRPCEICDRIFLPYQMDFDHLPGYSKVNHVSRLVSDSKGSKVILTEIGKCQVL